jgi:hypothetical protein
MLLNGAIWISGYYSYIYELFMQPIPSFEERFKLAMGGAIDIL